MVTHFTVVRTSFAFVNSSRCKEEKEVAEEEGVVVEVSAGGRNKGRGGKKGEEEGMEEEDPVAVVVQEGAGEMLNKVVESSLAKLTKQLTKQVKDAGTNRATAASESKKYYFKGTKCQDVRKWRPARRHPKGNEGWKALERLPEEIETVVVEAQSTATLASLHGRLLAGFCDENPGRARTEAFEVQVGRLDQVLQKAKDGTVSNFQFFPPETPIGDVSEGGDQQSALRVNFHCRHTLIPWNGKDKPKKSGKKGPDQSPADAPSDRGRVASKEEPSKMGEGPKEPSTTGTGPEAEHGRLTKQHVVMTCCHCSTFNPVELADLEAHGGGMKPPKKTATAMKVLAMIANEHKRLGDRQKIVALRVEAVKRGDYNTHWMPTDEGRCVIGAVFGLDGEHTAQDHHDILEDAVTYLSEDEVACRLVTLCVRSCFLPTKMKVTPHMLAERHLSLFWSLVHHHWSHDERGGNDDGPPSWKDVLSRIFPDKEYWSHLKEEQKRQRNRAPQCSDGYDCRDLAPLQKGSDEDLQVALCLFEDGSADNAFIVLDSCIKFLGAKLRTMETHQQSQTNSLAAQTNNLAVSIGDVTVARAGAMLLLAELSSCPNPTLEEPEVDWWQRLISTLVFPANDATPPLSAPLVSSKMLQRKDENVEWDPAMVEAVRECVTHSLEGAHKCFDELETKLCGEEAERSSTRDSFQQALRLVREKRVTVLVLSAFLSRIKPTTEKSQRLGTKCLDTKPETEECQQEADCLDLLEEAFCLCVGMQLGASQRESESEMLTLCRLAVHVRLLYMLQVKDSDLKERLSVMSHIDFERLERCKYEHELSVFDIHGMDFLRKSVLDPNRHTEEDGEDVRRKLRARACQQRSEEKSGGAPGPAKKKEPGEKSVDAVPSDLDKLCWNGDAPWDAPGPAKKEEPGAKSVDAALHDASC